MRRWSVGLVAFGLAVPLLLGGCAEKHPASQSLPTASKASASKALPPLGPADFPVPAEARQRTAPGASAFADYYITLANHLLANLDSAPLRQLSQNCATCTSLADGYDANRRAGYHYEGGRLTITSLGAASVRGDQAEIAFQLEQLAVKVLDQANTEVPGKTGDRYALSGGMSLLWDSAKSCWLVTSLTAERS